MKRLVPLAVRLSIALALTALPTCRAAADDEKSPELKQTEQEVEKLRRELQQKESELEKLKQENKRLKAQKTPKPTPIFVRTEQPAKPVRPMDSLPPLADGAVVEAHELAAHFQADPVAAEARYGRKVLLVKGQPSGFDHGLVTRNYDVIFQGGTGGVLVVCGFVYPDRYRAVYTTEHGNKLVARLDNGSEYTLARTGELLTIKGRCKGLKGTELIFSGCTVVK